MAATDPTPAVPAAPPRPWWVALLTSALTSFFGLALIVVAVTLVYPALPQGSDALWIGLVLGGAGLMGVGGSFLGRSSAPPDQRGRAAVHVLILALAAFVGAALVIGLATIASGCAGSRYAARKDAAVDWTPGPPCHIEVHLDGQKKPAVTVDAPEACEPAPDVCPVAPPVPQS